MDIRSNRIETANERDSDRIACAGGCGGSGMCPGQAILLSLVAGYGLSALTGWHWMQPLVLVTGTILLITGWYRYLNPFRFMKFKNS
ncbi:MAG: hypothetical protein ACP5I4_15445 [Oceanipulchritudo sp.]